ncbi:glycosyltransferase family 2 protein [Nonlabens sp.]|uniref:glycosyltransferase family 2 protein n=1 Tax=Nonlabens sp. TaxID=1888209 RepID=UPI003F69E5E6
MMFLILVISLGYLFIVLGLVLEGWTYKARPHRASVASSDRDNSFSIIINYRDESEHLRGLLHTITQLKYDFKKVEFLFINDGSRDDSLEILKDFTSKHHHITIQLLNRKPVSSSPKKDGITQAVALAKHEHIICTDADVTLPEKWLQAFNEHYKLLPDQHFVAGPVALYARNNLIAQLQHSEMVALQMTTMGSFSIRQPFMCNGANMSFTKTAFNEVHGYHGNDHISSGDDIFLLEKLTAEDVLKCSYLKTEDAIIKTHAKHNWHDMISQRVRWAQKGSATKSGLNKLVSFQVLFMSLLFILTPALWSFHILTSVQWIALASIKIVVDTIVIFLGNRFFLNKQWPEFLLPQLMIYPFLVVIIAFKSLGTTTWKNRQVEL